MAKTPREWTDNTGSDANEFVYDAVLSYNAVVTYDGVVPTDLSPLTPTEWVQS